MTTAIATASDRRAPLSLGVLALILAGALALLQLAGLRQMALFAVGAALGLVLYHAAFGFTSSWRVMITERRGRGLRAQMVMLALAVLLFFPALSQGDLAGQAVSGFVSPLGTSVLVGAFIFGVGMQLGGGCASGTLFTAGGGNARMLVTLVFFVWARLSPPIMWTGGFPAGP
ncbi:YeeE/YedE family protein [Oceanimonas sp. NS1]|nr:YeeE/YedE family protein [Oceanimonas sp. NS1]